MIHINNYSVAGVGMRRSHLFKAMHLYSFRHLYPDTFQALNQQRARDGLLYASEHLTICNITNMDVLMIIKICATEGE